MYLIDLEKAKKIALRYFELNDLGEIHKMYDSENIWIVFPEREGKLIYSSSGIQISKETGVVSMFILPSLRNFEILKAAVEVRL